MNVQAGSNNKVDKYLKKAMREKQSGNTLSAQEFYQKIIRLQPGNPDANCFLGEQYAKRSDYGKALKHLQLALDLAPHSPAIQNAMGNVYRGMKDYEKALSRFQRALALNPNWEETHYNLGVTYNKLGRYKDAEAHLRKTVALNPQSAAAHDILARLLEAQDNLDEAAVHFKQAAELDRSNLSARHHLAALSGETPDAPPQKFVLEIFDAHADQFEHYLVDVLHCQVPKLLRQALDRIAGADARFRSAMDLGCGTGLAGAMMRDISNRLSGVDLAPRMIAEAKKKQIYDELWTGDVTDCMLSSNQSYDLFVAADLFVYLGNLSALFESVAQHAAPGAHWVFSTEVTQHRDYVLLPSGRYAHSQNYIETLASAHGFSVALAESAPMRKEREDWIVGNIYILTAHK